MSINKKKDVAEKKIRLPSKCTFKGNLETYKITDTLQDSLYGKVYQGYGEDSGKLVAIKILSKNDIITKEMNRLLPETPLAEVFFADEMANHKYLATIRDVFETEDSHCIVSDLADGEDLLELLRKNRYGLNESQAKICMKQAAIALSKCHERGFALQDFSLENCLLYSVYEEKDINDENHSENVEIEDDEEYNKKEVLDINKDKRKKFQIKVCDPGQAVRFGRYNQEIEIPVPYLGCVGKKFRPPEIFEGKPYIASKVDSWCLGWSTFYLLFGTELFESVHNIDNDIRWKWYSMGYRDYLYSYLGINEKLSMDARSFIESLVHPDPINRMSIKEALDHPFLRDVNEDENLILEDWGRPLYKLENSVKSVKNPQDYTIPFIPNLYKTKYLKLYCTGDKPSGYFPINNNKSNVEAFNNSKLIKAQNQKSMINNSIPATNKYNNNTSNNNNNNNNNHHHHHQSSVGGLTGNIFQKRRGMGKGYGGVTSSINGRNVMNTSAILMNCNNNNNSNNNNIQPRVSINKNQMSGLSLGLGIMGITETVYNPNLHYQGQYQQQIYQNYHHHGYGYNTYYGSGYSGIGPFHSQYVSPEMSNTKIIDNTQKKSTESVSVDKKVIEAKETTIEKVKEKNCTESRPTLFQSSSSNCIPKATATAIATTTKTTTTTGTNNIATTATTTAATSPSITTNPNINTVVSSNKAALPPSTKLNNSLSDGRGMLGNSMMIHQNYGLPVVGGYYSSYVPTPKVGMNGNMQLGFPAFASGAKTIGTGSNSSVVEQYTSRNNSKNFSYVPPPLTSRNIPSNCHLYNNNHSHGQIKGKGIGGGGVSARLSYGSMSYVPPLMRR
ncbi:protein kinase [Cryptosporidium ubiquitum]|uniref:Protein kinase n=1 Tax=Cryptosporidium ubiquitum TaxID=857276 RepID=A0A1J4MP20_9CRYT|nr:protein kinase [Cryptosporidium ubiquitum]OII74764.1 protein kinase [Cryptosporidium ubiquitum]